MDPLLYTLIINIFKLIVPILLVVFGFILILRNNDSQSGEISFGKLIIKNSTAGVVFIAFGTVISIISINTKNGTEEKTTTIAKRVPVNELISTNYDYGPYDTIKIHEVKSQMLTFDTLKNEK